MKVSYIGKADPITFTNGKEYTVLSIERGWYRVLVDFGEDYLFPPEVFEVVEGGAEDLPEDKPENWWHRSQAGVSGIEKINKEKEMSARALFDANLSQASAQPNREKK